jgi:hypothetical protein
MVFKLGMMGQLGEMVELEAVVGVAGGPHLVTLGGKSVCRQS